jgi:hypothetical protein
MHNKLFEIKFGDSLFVDLADAEGYTLPHWVQRWVMPVLRVRRSPTGRVLEAVPIGTCFTIAPWLAVTATHIFDPPGVDVCGDDPSLSYVAIYVTDEPSPSHDGPWGGPIEIDKIGWGSDNDIALLRFKPFTVDGQEPNFVTLSLSFEAPQVGTPLLVFGYPESSAVLESPATIDRPATVELDQKIRASRGEVEEIHMPRRDLGRIKWPALQSNYPSPLGMSGGPVITDQGICGIVCSGFDPSGPDEPWYSIVSLLPLLLPLRVEVALDDDGVLREYRVDELIKRGAIPTDGSNEHIQITENTDGTVNITLRQRRA